MIYIDADFFIGLYYKEDAHHNTCLQLTSHLSDEDSLTSWDVVDETSTKLTYQTTKNIATSFLKDVLAEKIQIVFPNVKLFHEAGRIFLNQRSKHVSLTDCMNMAIAREKGIKYFLSFDKIYERNGFKLVK